MIHPCILMFGLAKSCCWVISCYLIGCLVSYFVVNLYHWQVVSFFFLLLCNLVGSSLRLVFVNNIFLVDYVALFFYLNHKASFCNKSSTGVLYSLFRVMVAFSFVVSRKYLEEPCVWVESNTTTLSILSSHAEIGLGFLLLLSLVSWVITIFSFFLLKKPQLLHLIF